MAKSGKKASPKKAASAKASSNRPKKAASKENSPAKATSAIPVPASTPALEMSVADLLAPKRDNTITAPARVHKVSEGIVCTTDHLARKRTPLEIVVDATEGFIPLWVENAVLRWRFNDAALSVFEQEDRIRATVRDLLTRAIALWGDAAPIRFDENPDNSDFEIVVQQHDRCFGGGCVLASAFFPDAGRHDLDIYPRMFEQSEQEQLETMAHELGHIFGLRHFFAVEEENQFPAVVFGRHDRFSIMNYDRGGLNQSVMTQADRDDLKTLYEQVWSLQLRNIGGTPIKLVRPYHYFDL